MQVLTPPWYKGDTLMQALDNLAAPEKPVSLPLRIPIQDVYSITGVGTVPVGRVETGVMKKGENVIFEPAGASGEVKSIEMHHETFETAEPGDNIGFNVRGVGKNDIRRGDVAGHIDDAPAVAKEFDAQIVVLQHPWCNHCWIHSCIPLSHLSSCMYFLRINCKIRPCNWSSS